MIPSLSLLKASSGCNRECRTVEGSELAVLLQTDILRFASGNAIFGLFVSDHFVEYVAGPV